MVLFERLGREYRFLRDTVRTINRVKSIDRASPQLACDDIEAAVDRWPQSLALACEARRVTYVEFDRAANRYAHWARARGLKRGDAVALMLPNRLDYIPAWYGLTKAGVVAALINNHLAGEPLRHCLEASGARHAIVDAETSAAVLAVRAGAPLLADIWNLDGAGDGERDLKAALKGVSSVRPDRSVRQGMTAGDTALYIFTSGTTGLPKAARMTHMRVQLYMRGFAGATDSRADDVIFCALPLYHSTGGLCAFGAAILNGGAFVISPRFSASRFWEELIAAQATMFVYIGELCRYLANQPERPQERAHEIRLAFGNGLRPDVWPVMRQRFRIPRILEFYGATEGNVSLFNFDGKEGAIARAPRYLRSRMNVRLIRFDVEAEAPVRGTNGLCIECRPGEVGECVGEIGRDVRSAYVGYADRGASEKKVLHDVLKRGDAFFATGDLMRQDRRGYLYFVDRIGDTFRWKSENVSTTEVAERLSAAPGVRETIVYGVEVAHQDGRAGMAAIVAGPEFDLKALWRQVSADLPSYAQPCFLRLLPEIETTGTFKYRKLDLVREGFDPAAVTGPLYYRDPERGYLPLDAAAWRGICDGEIRV
jgi:fatty-acyl-CoA synthase